MTPSQCWANFIGHPIGNNIDFLLIFGQQIRLENESFRIISTSWYHNNTMLTENGLNLSICIKILYKKYVSLRRLTEKNHKWQKKTCINLHHFHTRDQASQMIPISQHRIVVSLVLYHLYTYKYLTEANLVSFHCLSSLCYHSKWNWCNSIMINSCNKKKEER